MTGEIDPYVFTALLVKWVHQPEAEHRLGQVLGVLNGGKIYAPYNDNISRMSDRTVACKAKNEVIGEPKINRQWTHLYKSHLVDVARRRSLICFIAMHQQFFNAIFGLLPLDLPCYVVLAIIDMLPNAEYASRICKVKLIENIRASATRIRAENGCPTETDEEKRLKKYRKERIIMNALIVLKGHYTGIVEIDVDRGPQPSSCPWPHLCGQTSFHFWNFEYDCHSWEQWIQLVDKQPFLEENFTYYVKTRDNYWFNKCEDCDL